MSEDEEQDCCCNGLLTSNDVRTAIISGETFKNKTVTYAAVDGLAVFEGCIVLGKVDEVEAQTAAAKDALDAGCLLYTSPSPRDQRGSRMPSSA